MNQRRLALAVLIVLFALPLRLPAGAQSRTVVQARTHYALLTYSGPDQTKPIVGVVGALSDVVIEARSADANWVLAHTLDGLVRGWVPRRYLDYGAGSDVEDLPQSEEEMFVAVLAPSGGDYMAINLDSYPIVPTDLGQARVIFEQGQARKNDASVVSKIGDCISDNRHFLSPFGWNEYKLGTYTPLQEVVTHFSAAMAYDSLAAYDGLVTSAVLDPLFSNPLACQPGETPLRCEYRVHNPSVAVIMFGAQDLLFTGPEQFEYNLRRIVHETIQAGVIPIVSTFPGNLSRWNESILYNKIVVRVALDYNVPLMNLWRALDGLPNHGLNEDGRHLSLPITSSGDLTGENLRRGYPLRNLVTLQVLDAVWRGAMYP